MSIRLVCFRRWMLSSVSLTNFRAHHDVELSLEPLTALVGPNGVGKSAVLRAIDLVLGDRWPTIGSLRFPQDFTDFDTSRPLSIRVSFSKPLLSDKDALGKHAQVAHLQVGCKPYKNAGSWGQPGDPNFDFEALDAAGGKPMICHGLRKGQPPDFRPLLGVTASLRGQAPALLIDQRSLSRQAPGNRGSVLAKLLEPARRELDDFGGGGQETPRQAFGGIFVQAMEALRTPHVRSVERIIDETARRTLGFLGRSRVRDVRIGFGVADPANPLNSLRLVYREGGREVPAEEAGLGVQSAIVVALFEALRQTRQHAGVILIDEPEMYLHPQAQRYFHSLLVDMVDRGQAQVIYSTHSPVFAEAHRFESLRLLRQQPNGAAKVTQVGQAQRHQLAKDRTKLLTQYDASRSEALFADAALLVEGPGDQLAVREAAKAIPVDLDAENLSVISCGGKSAIPFHARLCRALEIPACALYDDDLQEDPPETDVTPKAAKTRENNKRARAETADIEAAIPSPRDRFVCSPSLERELGVVGGKDKPARVLATMQAKPERTPDAVRRAALRLADMVDAGPVPF